MTPNGFKNGWGILYNGMYLMIGWFTDDCCVGNCIELDGKWQIDQEGWYDEGDREAEHKEDDKYKNFELKNVILGWKDE